MKLDKKTEQKLTLNAGYYHEALDRCHVINVMIDEILLSHPVFNDRQNSKIREKIEKASMLIGTAYQEIGGLLND